MQWFINYELSPYSTLSHKTLANVRLVCCVNITRLNVWCKYWFYVRICTLKYSVFPIHWNCHCIQWSINDASYSRTIVQINQTLVIFSPGTQGSRLKKCSQFRILLAKNLSQGLFVCLFKKEYLSHEKNLPSK